MKILESREFFQENSPKKEGNSHVVEIFQLFHDYR